MGLCDSIFWQVNINDAPCLQHQLPYQAICDPFIKVPNVDGGLFILLPIASISIFENLATLKMGEQSLTNALHRTWRRLRSVAVIGWYTT